MTEFVDDIPLGRINTHDFTKFAQEVKDNPGKWGKLPYEGRTDATNVTRNVNRGLYKVFPRGEFEARTYQKTTWVRYIGGK